MNKDLFGQALLDYLSGRSGGAITTRLHLCGFEQPITEIFSPDYLFRAYDHMPVLEQKALQLCRGKVLDIGCGAGGHSLFLQQRGLPVTALDQSAGAVETCRRRGLKKVVHTDILQYNGIKFDTLLLLMNGIGIAGKLNRLEAFLKHLKTLLRPNGQILTDSSDIIYMYQKNADSSFQIPGAGPYYGEGRFVMEYEDEKGPEFPWLYLDYPRLETAAGTVGLGCQKVCAGPHYDYLARLLVKS